jgi:hypothetical protein
MLRQIKRIVPLSAAKMAAAIYGAMGVVLGFPLTLATVLPTIIHARQTETGLSAPVISLIVLALVIIIPIFYALIGFIIGIVGAAIYNLVARWLGGLQIEAE